MVILNYLSMVSAFFYGPAVNNEEPLEPHILVCGAQCELSQVVVLELLKPDAITESWRKEINKKFEWGNTRLHAMVSGCTVAQLKSLVAQGADIHAKNSDGDMPLHITAINRREEVVKQLISLGSKMDLRVAAGLGDWATLKTLLASEAKNELVKHGVMDASVWSLLAWERQCSGIFVGEWCRPELSGKLAVRKVLSIAHGGTPYEFRF
jgi:ankyrin repeat protein